MEKYKKYLLKAAAVTIKAQMKATNMFLIFTE